MYLIFERFVLVLIISVKPTDICEICFLIYYIIIYIYK